VTFTPEAVISPYTFDKDAWYIILKRARYKVAELNITNLHLGLDLIIVCMAGTQVNVTSFSFKTAVLTVYILSYCNTAVFVWTFNLYYTSSTTRA